ncbi:WD40-repeat-containing domain protein [Phlyctochytrium arcticum]|nr:WD40-repeat-containing domain protein [Phlyctochytrium arcticum]
MAEDGSDPSQSRPTRTPQRPTASSFLQPPTPATPRKRRRSDFTGDDEFGQRGRFDRFVSSGISPHAVPELRHAITQGSQSTEHATPSKEQEASHLPTPSSSVGPRSPYAQALGLDGDGRFLRHGPVTPHRSPTDLELTRERLIQTPTRSRNTGALNTPRSLSRERRDIPRVPERILDAPNLRDDYYINVVDWSSTNLLAVGLDTTVYLWDEKTSTLHELWSVAAPDYISVCSFSPCGTRIALGSEAGYCEIFQIPKDDFRNARCRTRIHHRNGLGAMSWSKQGTDLLLSTGDKLGVIRTYNTTARRPGEPTRTHCQLLHEWREPHRDRIVGLSWSPDGSTLASGGNDNLVCLWQLQRENPLLTVIREHLSAVRALAWCPWNPELLATGGGLEDRRIRVFTSRGEKKVEIETGSQVCAVKWSKNYKELVSAHHTSSDQLVIWSWPTMTEVARLPGHTARPLFLAMSPRGDCIVTGAGDESIKFWKCFQIPEGQRPLRPLEEQAETQRRLTSDMR